MPTAELCRFLVVVVAHDRDGLGHAAGLTIATSSPGRRSFIVASLAFGHRRRRRFSSLGADSECLGHRLCGDRGGAARGFAFLW